MAKKKLITSSVNHNVRVLLGLSCDEYVVMEVLHELYSEQPITLVVRLMNRIGTTEAETKSILVSLCEKKFLYISDEFIPMYLIDKRWLDCFDVNADFEEFFRTFREFGNKASSQKAYDKARKIADKETLLEAAKVYLAYCDETYSDSKYILKAQSWLDTKLKRWEDKIVLATGPEAEVQKKYAFL